MLESRNMVCANTTCGILFLYTMLMHVCCLCVKVHLMLHITSLWLRPTPPTRPSCSPGVLHSPFMSLIINRTYSITPCAATSPYMDVGPFPAIQTAPTHACAPYPLIHIMTLMELKGD